MVHYIVMKKTSLYLEEDVDIGLSRRAAAEGRSKAEIIREALRAAAGGRVQVKPAAIGVFAGPGDLAERADDYLRQTGFGES